MSGRNLLLCLLLVVLCQEARAESTAGDDDSDITVTPMPEANIVDDVTETSTEEALPTGDVVYDSNYLPEAPVDEDPPSEPRILEADDPSDEDPGQVVDYVVDDSLSRPRNIQVVSSTQRSITIRWDVPSPEVGLAGYRVFYENGFTELSNKTEHLENEFEIQSLGNKLIRGIMLTENAKCHFGLPQ